MSFYTCFDWLKKLGLFVNVRNRKIDLVLKASRAVVIMWFSLNEASLGLFQFISDYLPYFEKGYTVCTTWLRLFLHEPNKNCDQSLIVFSKRSTTDATNGVLILMPHPFVVGFVFANNLFCIVFCPPLYVFLSFVLPVLLRLTYETTVSG